MNARNGRDGDPSATPEGRRAERWRALRSAARLAAAVLLGLLLHQLLEGAGVDLPG